MLFNAHITEIRWLLIFTLCISSLSVWAGEHMSTRTATSDLTWKKLPNGRQIYQVYGDMKKGHHITFVKFAPGMKTPPHMHSRDYVGIVVKGTARHFQPGKENTKTPLPAGSTWAMPANVVHISECISEIECVFSIHQNGAYDLKTAK